MIKETKLTVQYLEEYFGDNVSAAIKHARETQTLKYPDKPAKPSPGKNITSAEVRVYADLLEAYEKELKIYNKNLGAYQKESTEINNIIEEYMKEISGLNSIVPADRRDKVWGKAWSDGHSSGYYEVYTYLRELVNIFE